MYTCFEVFNFLLKDGSTSSKAKIPRLLFSMRFQNLADVYVIFLDLPLTILYPPRSKWLNIYILWVWIDLCGFSI